MNLKTHLQKRSKMRTIRRKLRESGLNIYKRLPRAKRASRRLAKRHLSVYWVFAEPEGFMVLDIGGIDRFNTARKKNNLPKVRVRNADQMCVYRYPKRGWNVIKTHGYDKSKSRGNSRIRQRN